MSRPSGTLGSSDAGLHARKRSRGRRAAVAHGGPRAETRGQATAGSEELSPGALREIRHELGNFFHRLYYWIDRLDDHQAADGESAVRMLETTARTLETFLTTTLDSLHPITLAPVLMRAQEVVIGLRMRVPGCVAPADHASLLAPTGTVHVDPVLLPEVVAAGVEHLVGDARPPVPLRLDAREERDGGARGVLLELRCAGPVPPRNGVASESTRVLRWARARRIALLHGGWLAERAAADGSSTVAIFLPYAE